jgi:hypothetical protein
MQQVVLNVCIAASIRCAPVDLLMIERSLPATGGIAVKNQDALSGNVSTARHGLLRPERVN